MFEFDMCMLARVKNPDMIYELVRNLKGDFQEIWENADKVIKGDATEIYEVFQSSKFLPASEAAFHTIHFDAKHATKFVDLLCACRNLPVPKACSLSRFPKDMKGLSSAIERCVGGKVDEGMVGSGSIVGRSFAHPSR